MGLLDFFKKKSEEEAFYEAVKERDYIKIMELGKLLLSKHPNSMAIFSPYVDALVKLGRKEEALKELLLFSKKKFNEEYYDVAISLLKKALRLDPFNIEAIKLLSKAYEKKELLYDAFDVLFNSLLLFIETNRDTAQIKSLIEEFLKSYFYPLFYEKYGDILAKTGDVEGAVANYVLAANLYVTLKKPEFALRALLKARKLKSSFSLDKQLMEIASHISEETPEIISLLSSLIAKYGKNFDFIEFTVSQFNENKNLAILKHAVENIKNLLLRSAYLALIDYLRGEREDALEYLERLKVVDRELYLKVKNFLERNMEELSVVSLTPSEQFEELPEVEDVLKVLEEAVDLSTSTFETLEDISKVEAAPKNIKSEIEQIKRTTDGKRLLSMAEAFLGLGDYERAE
ncbi:MAG: hypothetical protein DSZ25_02405, partial [Thermovibrio sp.]